MITDVIIPIPEIIVDTWESATSSKILTPEIKQEEEEDHNYYYVEGILTSPK
jgi:hypothetical protein